MAKYHSSPWGIISGKLGDHVGGKWKGIHWVRWLIFPTQRGTLELYRMLKAGTLTPERFSYRQFNIRRVVLQILGYLARSNMSNLIYPVWEALCAKRNWTQTGSNAFVRRNAATLFNTMTDRNAEFDVSTNTIDLAQMIISDGDLEGTTGIIPSPTYDPVTGVVTVSWDTNKYTNGQDDDIALIMAVKKPLHDSVGEFGTWRPAIYAYGSAIPTPMVIPRSAGTGTLDIPVGLNAADITVYVFFRDSAGVIGYSVSAAMQCV